MLIGLVFTELCTPCNKIVEAKVVTDDRIVILEAECCGAQIEAYRTDLTEMLADCGV